MGKKSHDDSDRPRSLPPPYQPSNSNSQRFRPRHPRRFRPTRRPPTSSGPNPDAARILLPRRSTSTPHSLLPTGSLEWISTLLLLTTCALWLGVVVSRGDAGGDGRGWSLVVGVRTRVGVGEGKGKGVKETIAGWVNGTKESVIPFQDQDQDDQVLGGASIGAMGYCLAPDRCFNAYPLFGPLPTTIGNSDLSTFARWFHSVVVFNVVAAIITLYIHFTLLQRKHLVQTPGTSFAHLQPGIVALGLALVVGVAEGWAFVAVWGGRWGLAAMGCCLSIPISGCYLLVLLVGQQTYEHVAAHWISLKRRMNGRRRRKWRRMGSGRGAGGGGGGGGDKV